MARNDQSLRIITHFEGSRLGAARVADDIVNVELMYDEPVHADWKSHDYRLHFTFGIENRAPRDRKIRVRVSGGNRAGLPYSEPLIYASAEPLGDYRPIDVSGASDEYKRYDFDVDLGAEKTLYLANCLPRPWSRLVPLFDALAHAAGAKREVFGRTLEGRELVAYRFAADRHDRPIVLVSSGFHPPEPDTLATEALIEFLGSEEAVTLRRVFDFAIVPILNPDGYARGSQAGNAAGINLYWDFRHQDMARCPEAVHFYRYALALRPVLYFDFHAYTFQKRKHASPYCKPVGRYRGDNIRTVVAATHGRLRDKVADGNAMHGFSTYAPATLGEKLTRTLNTISYAKYHIHLKDGEQNCRSHAINAVRTACETLVEHGIHKASEVLVRPYGTVPKEKIGEIKRRIDVYWSGLVFPSLYSLYTKYLKKHLRKS